MVFCAGVDSCNGDSGGPLFGQKLKRGSKTRTDFEKPMFLRGVVSFGASFCGQGSPGVYTDVKGYMDWIRRNLKS